LWKVAFGDDWRYGGKKGEDRLPSGFPLTSQSCPCLIVFRPTIDSVRSGEKLGENPQDCSFLSFDFSRSLFHDLDSSIFWVIARLTIERKDNRLNAMLLFAQAFAGSSRNLLIVTAKDIRLCGIQR
jgi:hypothetical protein